MLQEFNFEQRSKEWYAAREGVPTASMASVLMASRGIGKVGKDYLLEKSLESIETYVEDRYQSKAMTDGVDREPIAAKYYESEKFVKTKEVGFFTRTVEIGGVECVFGCSPDRLVGEDRGLEIKCPENKKHKFNLMATEIPKEYLDQVQSCMWVLGLEKWDFMSFSPNFVDKYKAKYITVTRDEKWVAKFEERLLEATLIMNEYKSKL